jgi:hypothetical protein
VFDNLRAVPVAGRDALVGNLSRGLASLSPMTGGASAVDVGLAESQKSPKPQQKKQKKIFDS